MFGKAMKLPDHLVTVYLRNYTMVPLAEIDQLDALIAAGQLNPIEAKHLLGWSLVERYYSAEDAARELGVVRPGLLWPVSAGRRACRPRGRPECHPA
jgi:tyrosyl-tRNA synthetase